MRGRGRGEEGEEGEAAAAFLRAAVAFCAASNLSRAVSSRPMAFE